MAKQVVGVYDNQTELIGAIEEYKNKGYSVQDFSIIGDTSELSSALESRTGVTAEHVGENNNEDKGFWQNLMSAFDGDSNLGGNEPSLTDRLVGYGMTDEAAREYEEDVRNGRIVLLAETGGSAFTEAGDAAGAPLYGVSANSTSAENSYVDRSLTDDIRNDYNDNERTMKLREEQLDVSKETIQSGEVEVHKDVVEEQKRMNIPVTHEEVYVERRAVNELDNSANGTIDDGETIRVPIMEEKVEVTKKPVVSEELVIGKREVTDTEQVVENVKREEAHLETDSDRVVDGDLDRDRFKDR